VGDDNDFNAASGDIAGLKSKTCHEIELSSESSFYEDQGSVSTADIFQAEQAAEIVETPRKSNSPDTHHGLLIKSSRVCCMFLMFAAMI